MEVFISAVIGDLATRSLNFITSKLSKPTAVDMEDRLRRVLLRVQVIFDEAMGRHVTNQAMLLQLSTMRDAIYRGHYTLDTFSYQSHDEYKKDKVLRHSSSLSKVNYLNRLSFYNGNTLVLKQLQEAHDDLSSMILDVEELVMFLTSYPRMYHQPYSMHLQLANCMFGLQLETQLVINFLLHLQPHGAEELEVLPIVGPSYVGKSTLVTKVCKDERVHGHFSKVLFFRIYDFTEDELATFRKGCEIKHQNLMSDPDGRWIVVVELMWDLCEESWNRLYSASKRCVPTGSKIIVTSQYDKIVKFGTTQAVTLNYLPHQAFWYFFKTLTFGSTDPKMHPKLTHLAMEIAKRLKTAMSANFHARLLRDNFDTQFWFKVLTFLRGPFNSFRCGEHPFELRNKKMHAHLRRMAAPSEDIVIKRRYQRFSEEEVPEIRFQDVMYGSVRPHGEFEALAWRSQIPPYYSYVFLCEVKKVKGTAIKRKRGVL